MCQGPVVMPFDKEYPNRKDHRQPHRGAASFDRSCRNHGSCPWCAGNRTVATERRIENAADALMEVFGLYRITEEGERK